MKNLLWAVLVLSLSASAQTVTWQQIDIPGENQTITAMNNLGDMVGTTYEPNGVYPIMECFLRSHVDGTITFPFLGSGVGIVSCSGINDHGAIIGSQDNRGDGEAAVLYSQGTITVIRYPSRGGYTYTYATGINNAGTIVGYATVPSNSNLDPITFYLYQGDSVFKTYSLSSWGYTGGLELLGINNNGTFFGSTNTGSFLSNAAGPPVLISTLAGC